MDAVEAEQAALHEVRRVMIGADADAVGLDVREVVVDLDLRDPRPQRHRIDHRIDQADLRRRRALLGAAQDERFRQRLTVAHARPGDVVGAVGREARTRGEQRARGQQYEVVRRQRPARAEQRRGLAGHHVQGERRERREVRDARHLGHVEHRDLRRRRQRVDGIERRRHELRVGGPGERARRDAGRRRSEHLVGAVLDRHERRMQRERLRQDRAASALDQVEVRVVGTEHGRDRGVVVGGVHQIHHQRAGDTHVVVRGALGEVRRGAGGAALIAEDERLE